LNYLMNDRKPIGFAQLESIMQCLIGVTSRRADGLQAKGIQRHPKAIVGALPVIDAWVRKLVGSFPIPTTSEELATMGMMTRSTSGQMCGRRGRRCGLKPQAFRPALKPV